MSTAKHLVDEVEQLVHISIQQIDGIERTAYISGWRYGVVCGTLVGAATAGLGAWLILVALQALGPGVG